MKHWSVVRYIAVSAVLAFSVKLMATTGEPITVSGVTAPSQMLKLSFNYPGVIHDVPVKEGDVIKAGQVLLAEDDRIEQKQLESMRLEGDSLLTIDAQRTDWLAKQVDLKRKQEMKVNNVASDAEVEEAKLAVDLAAIRVKLAEQEHMQKKDDADKQQLKVDQMKLLSPIDAVVQQLNLGPGEMADPQNREGAVVIVKNDPLWVDVHLPTSQSLKLEMGETLQVRYADNNEWQPAKIIYFAPKVDAASDTQHVRLEMANKTQKASGLQVMIQLPAKVGTEPKPADPAATAN